MKRICEVFYDDEFEVLKEIKGTRTWRQFILTLTLQDKDNPTEGLKVSGEAHERR